MTAINMCSNFSGFRLSPPMWCTYYIILALFHRLVSVAVTLKSLLQNSHCSYVGLSKLCLSYICRHVWLHLVALNMTIARESAKPPNQHQ